MRKNFDFLAGASAVSLKKKFPKLSVEEISLSGTNAEVITATESPNKNILYLHGGGYFMGSIHSYRRNAMRLSYRCKARVFLLEYSLAPEHPFPTAVHEAQDAYIELLRRYPRNSMVIAGDSAGGGLALSVLLALKDRNQPMPSRAFCFSPWADMTCSGAALTANHNTDVWLNRKHLEKWAPIYGGGHETSDPHLSPVYGDFHGFPPLLLLAGDQEVLLDDSTRIVNAAVSQGVDARLLVGKQMQHVWPLSLPFLSESKVAMKAIADFVNE